MQAIVFCRLILYGQNITALKDFYQLHFGFSLTEEIPKEWVVLQAGNIEIAFHKIGKVYENGQDAFKVQSNAKLVFQITDSIITKRQQLLDAGVSMQKLKTFEGFPYLYCDGEDFEGNIFQLMQKVQDTDVDHLH
jgi:predicted enzyme related to lactoylglutathione lyase